MVCRNCGNETGGRYDCLACGYDPTKDDPAVKKIVKPMPTEVTPPPIEILLKKKANVPAILGFVFSILMLIPIPVVGWITCPTSYLVSLILTIVGFTKVKKCRSGRAFSVVSLILCILLTLLVVALVILIVALGGMGVFVELFEQYA